MDVKFGQWNIGMVDIYGTKVRAFPGNRETPTEPEHYDFVVYIGDTEITQELDQYDLDAINTYLMENV